MGLRGNHRTFDAELELKDAGLVASSAAATVDSAAKIVDLQDGASAGFKFSSTNEEAAEVWGDLVIDASAVEVASGDEVYTIILEGSNSATFASGIVPLAMTQLGDQAALLGAADTDSDAGRYIVPFTNVRDGVAYRYVRLYTVVAGTIATGINYSAYIGVRAA